MIDLAKGPAQAFAPLKAVLESISVFYAKYQVFFMLCSGSSSDDYISRDTVAVGDKIELLCSRITKLVKLFENPAGDEEEQKRRGNLLMSASGLRLDRMLKPS
jgi:hypothetical protein